MTGEVLDLSVAKDYQNPSPAVQQFLASDANLFARGHVLLVGCLSRQVKLWESRAVGTKIGLDGLKAACEP